MSYLGQESFARGLVPPAGNSGYESDGEAGYFFQFQRSARNHTLVGQVSSRATGSLLDRARSEQRERVLPGYYQMNWQSLLMPQTGPAAVQKMAKQRQMVILEIPIIAAYCHHDMPIVEATAVCFYPSRPEGAVWSPEDFSEVQKFVEEYMSAFQLCLCLNPSCSAHAVSDKFKAANGQHLTVDGMIEKFQMQERHVRRARLMLKHPAVHLPLRFSLSFKIPRIHVDAGGEARMWEPKEGTMSRQEHIAQGTELQTQKKKRQKFVNLFHLVTSMLAFGSWSFCGRFYLGTFSEFFGGTQKGASTAAPSLGEPLGKTMG